MSPAEPNIFVAQSLSPIPSSGSLGFQDNTFDMGDVNILAESGTEAEPTHLRSEPSLWQAGEHTESKREEEIETDDDECSICTQEGDDEGDDEWEDSELEDMRKKARTKMRSLAGLEYKFAGPKDKSGERRGLYGVDGLSDRTIRRRIESAKKRGDEEEVKKWKTKKGTKGSKQRTLWAFTATTSTTSAIEMDSDSTDENSPVKRRHLTEPPINLTNDSDQEPTLTPTLPEQPTPLASPVHAPETPALLILPPPESDNDNDHIIELLDLATLKKLVAAGLKRAKSKALTREINVYASLVDFYGYRDRNGRIKSANYTAARRGMGSGYARTLRAHARYFGETQSLRASQQGIKIRLTGILDDEGVMGDVKTWLRTMKPGTVTPQLLCNHMNSTILPEQGITKKRISVRQVQRWLPRLGYRRRPHMKGVYWDGHERKDVRKRRTAYLKELESLERLCTQYSEDSTSKPVEEITTLPTLNEGEKEHVIIYHDEMAVHANDSQKEYWARPDESVLRKKDPGRLMMVSDFITAATESGRLVMNADQHESQLKLPENERLPHNARTIIYPSSKPGTDDYWNMRQMINQLERTIKLAEFILPNKVFVFIFDNSSAHNSMSPDALHVSKMNVGPGGAASKMHDTHIPLDNPLQLGGTPQSMQFPDTLPDDDLYKQFEGKPKGIRRILEERGLVKVQQEPLKVFNLAGNKVVGQCKACKESKARKPAPDMTTTMHLDVASDSEDEEETSQTDCCMSRMLDQQQDFKDQKSLLEQVITKAGHRCVFLPKFHCELNPIEYYWGWVKRYFRERCTSSKFDAAKKLLTESLDACPGIVIRRFIRRATRYASVYRLGATGPLVDYAVRMYKSHRSVSQRELDLAETAKKTKDEMVKKVSLK